MATALLEYHQEDIPPLPAVHSELLSFVREFGAGYLTLSRQEVATALVDVEEISKLIDHLQTLTARAAEDHNLAASAEQEPHKNTAEYLRAKVGISRSEANRRLRLGRNVLPEVPGPGAAAEAPMAILGKAISEGAVSGRAATVVCDAVHRVHTVATSSQLTSMEEHLTRQAMESDEDILRILARRWESVLDQDGQEPTEKILKARQGVFLRGRRNGLHFMEIGATDEQYEHLVTVMNTAANPRTQSGVDQQTNNVTCSVAPCEAPCDAPSDASNPDRPTRAQNLLDGLVSACRIALSTDALPATGGHRPQVIVTINYRDLLGNIESRQGGQSGQAGQAGHSVFAQAGHSVFAQQMSAQNIRKLACDADILPLVLGGKGQILDIGRAQRLFPPHMRRALVARDKGCAFPDCSMPATWCEAHHIIPWATGGTTNVSDGVLLCARHHHLIHEGNWSIKSIHGIPWFKPPKYRDPQQELRRNRFWQVEEAVHQQLALSRSG